jgi:protein involved in sex pheromone biosynthesis
VGKWWNRKEPGYWFIRKRVIFLENFFMKKIIGLFTLVSVLLLAGCGKQKALDFNNKMVMHQKDVLEKITAFNKKMQAAVASSDFKSLEPDRKALEDLMNQKAEEVKKTPNVAGSENFKQIVEDNFIYFRDIFKNDYKQLTAATSPQQAQEVIQGIIKKADEFNERDQKLNQAQKDFAAKVGIKIEKK